MDSPGISLHGGPGGLQLSGDDGDDAGFECTLSALAASAPAGRSGAFPTFYVVAHPGRGTATGSCHGGGHPVGMEVSGRHGSRPPSGGDGAFRHVAAAGLLAAGGLPADSPDRRGCPPARDFRRREEGHLAKDGIFGYSPGYPGSRKRQGGKILP